jgi:hypothetical protein
VRKPPDKTAEVTDFVFHWRAKNKDANCLTDGLGVVNQTLGQMGEVHSSFCTITVEKTPGAVNKMRRMDVQNPNEGTKGFRVIELPYFHNITIGPWNLVFVLF